METGIFGAGCFWKPDLEFEKLKGVKKTEVGYCGGNESKTTYEKVCTGTTNHAEVVKVYYDENIISYEELLNFFLKFMIQQLLIDRGQIQALNIEAKFFILKKNKKKLQKKLQKK